MRLPDLSGVKRTVRAKPLVVLPCVLIVLLVIGYLVFFIAAISPALAARSKSASQLLDAQKQLVDTQPAQPDTPEEANAKLANAKATLSASMNVFLTDSQQAQVVSALYQNAGLSGVTVVNVQTQPVTPPPPPPTPKPTSAPEPTSAPAGIGTATAPPPATATIRPQPTSTATPIQRGVYSVMTMRVEAKGDSFKLADFVARAKGTFPQGVIVNSVTVSEAAGMANLVMDLTLYTTSLTTAAAPVAGPVRPTIAVAPPTVAAPAVVRSPAASAASPTPAQPPATSAVRPLRITNYVVRQGDTLASLSAKFGTPAEAIRALNRLTGNTLQVGQTLAIPQP